MRTSKSYMPSTKWLLLPSAAAAGESEGVTADESSKIWRCSYDRWEIAWIRVKRHDGCDKIKLRNCKRSWVISRSCTPDKKRTVAGLVGCTIRGFVSLASTKYFDKSTWNLIDWLCVKLRRESSCRRLICGWCGRPRSHDNVKFIHRKLTRRGQNQEKRNRFTFKRSSLIRIVCMLDVPSFSPTHHLTCYTLPLSVKEMANSSNVFIHGSTFNSAQGDFHIHSRDSESGMYDFLKGLFRRASLSMTQWRSSWTETRGFSWSDSWFRRTLPASQLSPWYPQGRSTNYFRLDP